MTQYLSLKDYIMAICLFTTKCYDGSGDVVQTVKIADFIQKFIKLSELEELKTEVVIIVVKDDENKEIASRFVKDINPNIQVKKISEFKEENHKINCCIEAGYSHFDWEKELSFKGAKPPLIVMPEYDNDVNRKSLLRVLGGFDNGRGDVGVIPSPALLAATAGEMISQEVLKNAFEGLDPKIQSYLGKDVESYLAQREQRDFSYQYSHDRNEYPTFYTNSIPYKSYQSEEETTQGEKYAPVQFFLQEHVMLMGNSAKSQDVLCIGENSNSKLQALTRLKEDLIQKGYTRVSFIDINSKDEKVIYEGDNHGAEHKEYRVLYSKSMPFSSMQVLPLIATDIVGVTGDQSLAEAMSAKKLVTYECVSHKKDFARGYLKAVQREVSEMVLKGTSGQEVLLLARFLIKPTYRCDNVEYKQEEISRLLSNRNTVEALKNINRQLIEKSQYFASIEKMLVSEVLSYIRGQHVKKFSSSETLKVSSNKEPSVSYSLTTESSNLRKSLEPKAKPQKIGLREFRNKQKIVELLRRLHTEVTNNKTNSTQWNKRFDAATQLYQLTDKEVISQENSLYIKAQLEIIKQNEPSWFELSLVTQISDVLSLGLVYIIRHLFFTPDKTMTYLQEIERELAPSRI
ncbi:Uncharacterised protein [Legionella hackeliae]|uniref:Uncharacterized protein n=2 Tax=Legionella hackeliae TaxID=449 RepID=A0A0A8USX1_LEGHA|nr:hypothetical protein Lhac_0538 [Legionella hackeliae]CEK10152.1 conserved protein of unknown function [Legionella hackeliae]STX46875.1 Uncharacterised protein [Legionella hackeliae]